MTIFGKLREARVFARQNMEFLATLEDVDLLLEIGFHQERGQQLTVNELYRMNLASVATVQRRLRRLREAKVLVEQRSQADRRSVELALAPPVFELYEKYAAVLGSR